MLIDPHMLISLTTRNTRVISHNLLNPEDLIKIDRSVTPKAVFGNPQIASAGFSEDELLRDNVPHLKSIREYSDTAFGWAMEDEQGFVMTMLKNGLLGV